MLSANVVDPEHHALDEELGLHDPGSFDPSVKNVLRHRDFAKGFNKPLEILAITCVTIERKEQSISQLIVQFLLIFYSKAFLL